MLWMLGVVAILVDVVTRFSASNLTHSPTTHKPIIKMTTHHPNHHPIHQIKTTKPPIFTDTTYIVINEKHPIVLDGDVDDFNKGRLMPYEVINELDIDNSFPALVAVKNYDDDLLVVTTHKEGLYEHQGFDEHNRLDEHQGLNEHKSLEEHKKALEEYQGLEEHKTLEGLDEHTTTIEPILNKSTDSFPASVTEKNYDGDITTHKEGLDEHATTTVDPDLSKNTEFENNLLTNGTTLELDTGTGTTNSSNLDKTNLENPLIRN